MLLSSIVSKLTAPIFAMATSSSTNTDCDHQQDNGSRRPPPATTINDNSKSRRHLIAADKQAENDEEQEMHLLNQLEARNKTVVPDAAAADRDHHRQNDDVYDDYDLDYGSNDRREGEEEDNAHDIDDDHVNTKKNHEVAATSAPIRMQNNGNKADSKAKKTPKERTNVSRKNKSRKTTNNKSQHSSQHEDAGETEIDVSNPKPYCTRSNHKLLQAVNQPEEDQEVEVEAEQTESDNLLNNNYDKKKKQAICVNMSSKSNLISNNQSITSLNRMELAESPKKVRRAISETMLSFDAQMQFSDSKSFEVKWRNLDFAYEQSLIKTVTNLTINRNSSRKDEQILKNLSGSLKSNQLVAIVGPSGCGKTTFLQLLSGNMRTQSGQLTIEGLDEPRVSFIGQGDLLLPDLTCRETLIYSSRLQNTSSNFDHSQHIEPVLQALGLAECAHRPVQKLSGGQLKRVSIAQELLYPTNLLILDEITSGLDASTSYSIIKQLKRLTSDASYPMTIVISIHQPSARLFAVFDKVYVMSKGRCLYDGSCKVDIINKHLRHFGLECPKFTNIADYLIEIASDDMHTNDIRDQLFRYHEQQHDNNIALRRGMAPPLPMIAYNKPDQTTIQIESASVSTEDDGAISTTSTISTAASEPIPALAITRLTDAASQTTNLSDQLIMTTQEEEQQQQQQQEGKNISSWTLFDAIERARARRSRPFFKHFAVHFERSSRRLRRSYIFTYMQLLTYCFLGFQLTTFFGPDIGKLSGCPQLPMSFISYVLSSEDDDTISLEMRRIQENVNFLLVVVMTATFAALEITVITFPLEAKTVKREWRNGRYRVSSYFSGRTMADLPIQIVCVFLYSLLTFHQTGQYGLYTWRFLSYCIIITCCGLAAQTVGFLFGAIFMDSLPLAVFTAPLSIFPALLFSGFFARVNTFAPFYKILSRISHFRYAFEALIVTIYGHNRCTCDQQTLTQYHQNLDSQTNTMREMFKTMLGVSGCPQQSSAYTANNGGGDVEDTTGFTGDIDSFVAKDLATTPAPFMNLNSSSLIDALITSSTSTTTERPMKAFEDALIESVYAHMNSTTDASSGTGSSATSSSSAVDMVMSRFTTKITQMFNSRSNFGRPVPKECSNFNSYLIGEFELKDHDLIQGILVLFFVVVAFRILCNYLLTLTMRTKITS